MSLDEEFDRHLHQLGEATRKHNYIPTYFIRMLEEFGGGETAKRLLRKSDVQQGLIKLYDLGLLKESVEAAVINEKFQPLFTKEEIEEARRRLEALNFFEK